MSVTNAHQGELAVSLTARELDVLRLLVERLTNREIANRLNLSVGTVKWYNKQIYRKLGVANRREAAARGLELGLTVENHNLPSHDSPFVGREHELDELEKLLRNPHVRLITVHGAGGIGKTRLAVEAVRRIVTGYPQGAYFVPLAALDSNANIVEAIIAHTPCQPKDNDHSHKQQLLDYLSDKKLLLILDKVENVFASIGLLTDILNHAPDVQILVTSREVLNLQDETVFTVIRVYED